jgi:hypothetical protein
MAVMMAAPVVAMAADYTFAISPVDAGKLQLDIQTSGITLSHITCSSGNCTAYNASADPAAVVAAYVHVDPVQERATNLAAALALYDKLVAQTITAAEKDELLRLLVLLLLK